MPGCCFFFFLISVLLDTTLHTFSSVSVPGDSQTLRNRSLGIDLLLFRQNEFKNKDGVQWKSSFSWMKGQGANT